MLHHGFGLQHLTGAGSFQALHCDLAPPAWMLPGSTSGGDSRCLPEKRAGAREEASIKGIWRNRAISWRAYLLLGFLLPNHNTKPRNLWGWMHRHSSGRFCGAQKGLLLVINYLLLGWPHWKCLLYFRSAFDNNEHSVLLTQLWFLAGRTQLLELVSPTTGFWGELEKQCLDFKPVYTSQFKKPSESDTSHSGQQKLPSTSHLGKSGCFYLEHAF